MIPDLVTFTEEILNGKFHFLCSVYSLKISRNLWNRLRSLHIFSCGIAKRFEKICNRDEGVYFYLMGIEDNCHSSLLLENWNYNLINLFKTLTPCYTEVVTKVVARVTWFSLQRVRILSERNFLGLLFHFRIKLVRIIIIKTLIWQCFLYPVVLIQFWLIFFILGYYLLSFKYQKMYSIIFYHVLQVLSILAILAIFSYFSFPPVN